MFSRSPRPITLLFGLFVLAAGLAMFAKTGPKTSKKTYTVTATGCLKPGVVVDRFHLTGQDGKSYALRSSSIKLSDYVGRAVTITGRLKRDQKRDDYDFEGSEVNEEYGKGKTADFIDVEVTSFKSVGAPCR